MSEKQEHSGAPGEGETGANVSRETSEAEKPSSPGPQKNKRSSVYVYLAVLFGAAFLMLLLAYFIQQRNNETTISGLQSSWNLSREELMQENDRLEEENLALWQDKEAMEAQLAELQRQTDELEDQFFWRERDLEDQVFSWKAIFALEEDFRTEAYDRCVMFFEIATTANHYGTPPEAADRVEEIYWTLVEQGVLNEEDFPLSSIFPGHG